LLLLLLLLFLDAASLSSKAPALLRLYDSFRFHRYGRLHKTRTQGAQLYQVHLQHYELTAIFKTQEAT